MLNWEFKKFKKDLKKTVKNISEELETLSRTHSIIIEPLHEISNNVVYATSKVSDQPAHTRSLIRAFASRLNILCLLSY